MAIFKIWDTYIAPAADEGMDVGSPALQFKDGYFTGIIISGGGTIQFRNSGIIINSNSDGYLDLNADTGIRFGINSITKATLDAYGYRGDTVFTAVPATDHTASGIKITLTAHTSVAFGDVCFINSSGEAQLINATSIATMSGVVMATASIDADTSGQFLLHGIATDASWAWVVGGLIYGTITGTTGNTLSQAAPNGTDHVVQLLGVATHINRMYFNPSLPQVEHI